MLAFSYTSFFVGASFISAPPQIPPHVHLSGDAKDLLHKILQPAPKHRLSWSALASHLWLKDTDISEAASSADILGTSLPNFVPFGRSILGTSF